MGNMLFYFVLSNCCSGSNAEKDANSGPIVNLWSYFNTNCFSGFSDGK